MISDDESSPKTNLVVQTLLDELREEQARLPDDFSLCSILIDEAIERYYSTGLVPGCETYADVLKQTPMKLTQWIKLPKEQYDTSTVADNKLGPHNRDLLVHLQEITECEILFKGRNSMLNKNREIQLRQSGDARYRHLNKDPFLEVSTVAKPVECHTRMAYAISEIRKYLKSNQDDYHAGEDLFECTVIDPDVYSGLVEAKDENETLPLFAEVNVNENQALLLEQQNANDPLNEEPMPVITVVKQTNPKLFFSKHTQNAIDQPINISLADKIIRLLDETVLNPNINVCDDMLNSNTIISSSNTLVSSLDRENYGLLASSAISGSDIIDEKLISNDNVTIKENLPLTHSSLLKQTKGRGIFYMKDKKLKKIITREISNKLALLNYKTKHFKDIVDSDVIEHIPLTIEYLQQTPTDLVFEFTPSEIMSSLIDNMEKHPVLWEFHDKPANEGYCEAIEKLCNIINSKWNINIDAEQMHRSIYRIIRSYRFFFPFEYIKIFKQYFDKCSTFLPSLLCNIPNARCSYCYICFKSDCALSRHIIDEHKFVQNRLKCYFCSESFKDLKEYEFHKRLPHIMEIFRCEKCNKGFNSQKTYIRHKNSSVHQEKSLSEEEVLPSTSKKCQKPLDNKLEDNRENKLKEKFVTKEKGFYYMKDKKNKKIIKRETASKNPYYNIYKDVIDTDEINCKPLTIESFRQNPTELVFEYTPHDIMLSLMENMQKYPVLWQFHDEPYNEGYTKAIKELCQVMNDKWSLNLDTRQMQRSVYRILRFYRYFFRFEYMGVFKEYLEKCHTFLPSLLAKIPNARCSECFRSFETDSALNYHIKDEHTSLLHLLKCYYCPENYSYENYQEYKFHKRLPHILEIFRCDSCNKEFINHYSYVHHINTTVVHRELNPDEPKKFICEVCGKKFTNSEDLQIHKSYHKEKKFRCKLCAKIFKKSNSLRVHLQIHRQEFAYICEICGKSFYYHNHLKAHVEMHAGIKVTCNICNSKVSRSNLRRHLSSVHVPIVGKIEKTIRKKCHHRKPRQIVYRPTKRRTKRVILPYKYVCKICKIHFDRLKLLKDHNKELHFMQNSLLPCRLCDSKLTYSGSLKRHYKEKHKLHEYQVFCIVNKNMDTNEVLAMKPEFLNSTEFYLDDNINKKYETAVDDVDKTKNEIVIQNNLLLIKGHEDQMEQEEVANAVDDNKTNDHLMDLDYEELINYI